MIDVDRIVIVIPSYNPDEKLKMVVDSLFDAGFSNFLIVDDGSKQECKKYFEELTGYEGVTILSHENNYGKGRALKTAFNYIEEQNTAQGIITVDGDNQHKAEDVLQIADAMIGFDGIVLGTRDFDTENVPQRSKIGNKTTSFIFKNLLGVDIHDTQTGLRGMPTWVMEKILSLQGERFEYETNVLMSLNKLRIPFKEVKIKTVYIEENKTSHFNPFKDSLKILGLIGKFLFSSMVCFFVDILLFYSFVKLFSGLTLSKTVFFATIIARICSSLLNFAINRKAVFSSQKPIVKSIAAYYALAIGIMFLSFGGTYLLTLAFNHTVMMKVMVDLLLFGLSFGIQRKLVF